MAVKLQYDSHLEGAPSPPRLSWNMHDMLMYLVPNLIIQFHRSLRQPSPRTAIYRSSTNARTHARTYSSRKISFTPSKNLSFLLSLIISLRHRLSNRRSPYSSLMSPGRKGPWPTRKVARSKAASIIGFFNEAILFNLVLFLGQIHFL